MHHVIRPRPPVGGVVLGCVVVALGLVGFAIGEATQRTAWSGWSIAGLVVVLVGLALLAVVAWSWWRAVLVVDTDRRGLTAAAAGVHATARWEEVSAVTATEDELRVRRHAGRALVLRMPTGARTAQVTALTDDVADCLRTQRT